MRGPITILIGDCSDPLATVEIDVAYVKGRYDVTLRRLHIPKPDTVSLFDGDEYSLTFRAPSCPLTEKEHARKHHTRRRFARESQI